MAFFGSAKGQIPDWGRQTNVTRIIFAGRITRHNEIVPNWFEASLILSY